MPKGILYVESRPRSAEHRADYNRWYEETHLRQVVGVDGFVSAQRYAPVDGDGPYVAIYEIEADDLQATVTALREATKRGEVEVSDLMQLDPPPTIRLLELVATYEPATDSE